ncbi:MAG: cell division protein FtsA [Elusimicrobia bacterium RIFOXYD2_FULL_34_15]|nr:MAG: cell division protein FtsA [Elusimicrobia bacterium RIFOXYD2_FULL_34_15]
MARERIIAGLDVGSSKVTCVIARKDDSDLPEIISIATAPCKGLRQGTVVNRRETESAITTAVDQAEEMANEKIDNDEVVVSIKGQHVESLNHSSAIGVTRTDKEIIIDDVSQVMSSARAIRLGNDKEIIHIIPQEFIVDGQKGITDPVGLEGSHLEVNVHIVIGLTSSINNLGKCVSNAGFVCKNFVSSILASGEVIVSPEEKNIGCVLIDMGAQTTDIAIYLDGSSKCIKEIPLGGDSITMDLARGLGTSFHVAQDLKERYGSAISTLIDGKEEITYISVDGRTQKKVTKRTICDIIRPRLEEILSFVNDAIDKTQYRDVISAGSIITGGGCQLLGMKEASEEVLQMQARIGIPQYVRGSANGIGNPSFASAIGLVKYSYISDFEKSGRYTTKKPGVVTKIKKMFEDMI